MTTTKTSGALGKTRRRIKRGGRTNYIICLISEIILGAMTLGQAALTVAVLYSPKAAQYIGPRLNNNFLFNFLKRFAGIDTMPEKYQAAIGCAVLFIMYVSLFIMLRIFARMMKYLAEGDRPLDVKAARQMRHRAYTLLMMLFYNPIVAGIAFSIVMLFSYVMEYGGYIQERADETNRIQEEMILSFAEITENKSGQTGQHIKRVSEYSRVIAEALGLGAEEVEAVRIASTMHDVGKLLIPSEILEKPGKLTDAEYAAIKTHTTMGGRLLENVEGEEMQLSRTIALQHHERYDGKGYPAGLQGDEISLEGRIVAVADVYDALTSRRSYKDAWREEDACREILNGRGTQFDPRVVDAFAAAHDKILAVREQFRD